MNKTFEQKIGQMLIIRLQGKKINDSLITLIKDVNDSVECAKELANLIHSLKCNINLIPFDKIEGKIRVEAKIRYSQSQSPAYAEQTGDDEITLTFDTPQRAPAKGQSAVMYDGDLVIGGGIIQ